MKRNLHRFFYLLRLNALILLMLAFCLWIAYCVIIVTAEVLPNALLD